MAAAFTDPAGTRPDHKPKPSSSAPCSSTNFSHTQSLSQGCGFKEKSESQTNTTVPQCHVQRGPYASSPSPPHLPITTPSKINRFTITQLFNRSKMSHSYGKSQPAPRPVPPPRAPQKDCGSVAVSRVTFCIPAIQRDSANLYHLFSFPCFGLGRPKMPWHGTDPSGERWGLQPPPRHHQARLAAMLMRRRTAAPSNGHCGTKLTVHLLLAADAGESGL